MADHDPGGGKRLQPIPNTVLGESLAWIVGWSLIPGIHRGLQRGGGRLVRAMWRSFLPFVPHQLLAGPEGRRDRPNLPAILICFLVAGVLIPRHQAERPTVNVMLVVIKIVALTAFVIIAGRAFDPNPLPPLQCRSAFPAMGRTGERSGVMAAASINLLSPSTASTTISTAAEETVNPGRDLTIGIIGSMVSLHDIIYMAVAARRDRRGGARSCSPKSSAPLVLVLDTLKEPLTRAAGGPERRWWPCRL